MKTAKRNIKLRAIHTTYHNAPCVVKPVFFPKETGLQFAVIEGDYQGSWFACNESQFTFYPLYKPVLLFIKAWYWVEMVFWRKVRYQMPYRIRQRFFSRKGIDDLPF